MKHEKLTKKNLCNVFFSFISYFIIDIQFIVWIIRCFYFLRNFLVSIFFLNATINMFNFQLSNFIRICFWGGPSCFYSIISRDKTSFRYNQTRKKESTYFISVQCLTWYWIKRFKIKKKTIRFYTFDNEKNAKNTLDFLKTNFCHVTFFPYLPKPFYTLSMDSFLNFKHITFSTKAFAYDRMKDEKLWFSGLEIYDND